jgi:hypothetical protein
MRKLAPICAVFAVIVGMVAQPSMILAAPIQSMDPQFPRDPAITEQDLKAFAKAYVEFHKIGVTYENSVNQLQDKQEESRAQHEALIKIDQVLQKHGLEQTTFVRILELVNSDEALWAKAMKLIEEVQRTAG